MALWKYGRFLGESQITLTRPPFETTNKWENLCLPADHATNKLVGFHQKNADASGHPWVSALSAYGHIDGKMGMTIVNSGTTVLLHLLNQYATAETALPSSGYPSQSGWSLDTANKKFAFEFFLDNDQEEESAVVIADDTQTSFWTYSGEGAGTIAWTLTDDTDVKEKGANSLKIVSGAGSSASGSLNHTYGSDQDWSGKDFFCYYWYGANTGATFRFILFGSSGHTGANAAVYPLTDNFTGWKRIVVPLIGYSEAGGDYDTAYIYKIHIDCEVSANTVGTWYLDRMLVDTGQWVATEVYVPDTILASGSAVKLWFWSGAAYSGLEGGVWNPNDAGSSGQATRSDHQYFMDGSTATQLYNSSMVDAYVVGLRGESQNRKFAAGPASITYSSNYGCQNRLGFAIKMPPEDGQDSSTTGISQCRLKLEVYYDDDGDATYEFHDSANQYYGLQNINKQYIVLFKDDVTGLVDFLELKAGLSINALTVKANHNNEISEVVIGFSGVDNSKEVFWGQSDENPATETDNIPDVITNIEALVDGGGY